MDWFTIFLFNLSLLLNCILYINTTILIPMKIFEKLSRNALESVNGGHGATRCKYDCTYEGFGN